MKTVCKKDSCTGCMACRDICPRNAVEFKDSIKAYNAVINEDMCIGCGACYRVCQIDNPVNLNKPNMWYQGWAKENNLRENSSSGGVATAIEKGFILKYGEVCSCLFSEGKFIFRIAKTVDEVKKFSGSKYVKSNPSGCYKEVKSTLSKGKSVLFVGLPCQVAAVKKFVGEKLIANLYTIDLICHGSPDQKVLKTFLSQYDIDISMLDTISFRTKTAFQLKQNLKSVGIPGAIDKYSIAFLNSICYTENCYECQYARLERSSDVTLGDSWGTNLSNEEQKRGISLILCQTKKGQELLDLAELELREVDLDCAVQYNHQLIAPSKKPSQRDYFMKEIEKGIQFNKIVSKCYPKSCLKQLIKGCLVKAKIIEGGADRI